MPTSIFDNVTIPAIKTRTAEDRATQLGKAALFGFKQTYNALGFALKSLWVDGDPVATVAALGPAAAKELFETSTATFEFLEKVKPGSTTELAKLIKPHVLNEDGTLTLLP